MEKQSGEALDNPRILITGATGFLGKYAVEEFYCNGYSVVASGRNVETLSKIEQDGIQSFPATLNDLGSADVEVDYVIHAAAFSSVWGKRKDFFEHNVVGTKKVIDFCMNNQVKRLVYVSSPSIYSTKGNRYNIPESATTSGKPLNNYIRSKIAAEAALHTAHEDGLIRELVILRPRGLFGVGDTSLIPRLLQANDKHGIPLFNNGENLVDITCVENVALALRLAIESSRANGKTYNITNGEPRPFRSIVDDFFEGIGKTPRYIRAKIPVMYAAGRILESAYSAIGTNVEPPLTRYTVCTIGYSQTLDISQAKRDLDYLPFVSLDQGIQAYIKDYKDKNG